METNHHDDADTRTGDLLFGADAIREDLISLGAKKNVDPYYEKRSGNLPIGNSGGDRSQLIASKQTLAEHFQKKARGSLRDAQ